ncbi:MAG: response regulator [Deltaproteobacteria bacterium]|nr:response regulator [Deltaproteobacteria bacterium]
MLVWIVDDDVSFAYGFKNRLKALQAKVEVFTDVDSFLKKSKKVKKEKLPLPDVIFMDVEFPDQNGTDLYLEFLDQKDPIAGKFYFCSALSYGRFAVFFGLKGLNPPPFVQKSSLEREWEKIVEACRPEDEKNKTPIFSHPLARRKIRELDELKKQLGDLYYKGAFGDKELAVFIKLAEKIGALATSLSIERVGVAAEALVAVLGKTGTGVLRVKKEVRDFILLLEKTLASL